MNVHYVYMRIQHHSAQRSRSIGLSLKFGTRAIAHAHPSVWTLLSLVGHEVSLTLVYLRLFSIGHEK